jgi:hypothetical protein
MAADFQATGIGADLDAAVDNATTLARIFYAGREFELIGVDTGRVDEIDTVRDAAGAVVVTRVTFEVPCSFRAS